MLAAMSDFLIAEDAAYNLEGLCAAIGFTPPSGDAPPTDGRDEPTVLEVFFSDDRESAFVRFVGPRARDLSHTVKKQNLASNTNQILFWAGERFDESGTRALIRSLGLMLDHFPYERVETETALRKLAKNPSKTIAPLAREALERRGLSV